MIITRCVDIFNSQQDVVFTIYLLNVNACKNAGDLTNYIKYIENLLVLTLNLNTVY